jgi:hypothetical protein
MGAWVGFRAAVDAMEKRNPLILAEVISSATGS